jgi:SAM-dependent methyltransferase
MEEVEKYRGIYTDTSGRYKRYGHSNHGGAAALAILAREKPRRVLDAGCGWNEFAIAARARGIDTTGVDFACPGADVVADIARGLPFPDKAFEVITSFDMLEHLRPDQVDAVLAEMCRLSWRFILSISYVPSVNKWQGETLHPTVRDEAWWIEQLTRHGAHSVRKDGKFLVGRWSDPLAIDPASRVVLVGNGPSVLGSALGPRIDAHDVVVRFNNFKVSGYEPDVGTRTDLWSTFFRRIDDPLAHHRVICIHENDRPTEGVTFAHFIPGDVYAKSRRIVQERARLRHHPEVDRLLATSGLIVALYLVQRVGVQIVSLAGFDHFRKERSGLHHYWINRSYKKPREHDGEIEAEVFAELERAGRVRYLR